MLRSLGLEASIYSERASSSTPTHRRLQGPLRTPKMGIPEVMNMNKNKNTLARSINETRKEKRREDVAKIHSIPLAIKARNASPANYLLTIPHHPPSSMLTIWYNVHQKKKNPRPQEISWRVLIANHILLSPSVKSPKKKTSFPFKQTLTRTTPLDSTPV
ncbi:hypothetical protein CC80DRAFT_32562 [Byssothecium circinans]|uniref:Uncharacterized protein n=1 Tax=Byssothecium circinans TaxID=147558 RepID=A0A6A5U409_9PLEO|nr:hypothetical protein CC80DRAFT_32562 [Byssothecium circinans]